VKKKEKEEAEEREDRKAQVGVILCLPEIKNT